MTDCTFFWHDYETFGLSPRRDRPAQFAGIRTDADLNEIDTPLTVYCQPAPDYLPDPASCLLTGILPQACLADGLPEHAFAAAILQQLARPGTIGVGYNTIRFDDEVTRHLFWRNLIDPYAREWQSDCGRWDLLDVVRCAWALRPEGIEWPQQAEGGASFRLEHLSRANGLAHDAAHDALSDVRATLALARLLKRRQPKLYDFCLRLRRKDAVLHQLKQAEAAGRPFLHISGRYPVERGCMALVWPLAPHPTNRNELIVWDLAEDPAELSALDAGAIRERIYCRAGDLPEGVRRLPIKTIHFNKSPVVIAKLETLSPARAAYWGIDVERALRHAAVAPQHAAAVAGLWTDVCSRPPPACAPDVDDDLYGALPADSDRRLLQRLRSLPPEQLAAQPLQFADRRLEELLFRWRARNFPQTLDAAEQARWERHCSDRLHQGAGGSLTLGAYFERIDALSEAADDRGQAVLGALYDYAVQIAPERVG